MELPREQHEPAKLQPLHCIDFAYACGGSIFLFGWVAERGPEVVGISAELGPASIDLSSKFARYARPDVIEGVGEQAVPISLDCGILIAFHAGEAAVGERRELVLSALLAGGGAYRIQADLSDDPAKFRDFVQNNEAVLRELIGRLPREEGRRLEAIAWPRTQPAQAPAAQHAQPAIEIEIEHCCVPVPGQILLVGWVFDPRRELSSLDVCTADGMLLKRRRLRWCARPDVLALRAPAEGWLRGFVSLAEFDADATAADELVLSASGPAAVMQKPLKLHLAADQGMSVLATVLQSLAPDLRVLVLEELNAHVPRGTDPARFRRLWAEAIEALPNAATCPELGVWLHVDEAVRVAGRGVFLVGWAVLDPERTNAVALRLPTGAAFEMLGHWVRHERLDVWRARRAEGVALSSDDLGFMCFVAAPIARDLTSGYFVVSARDDVSVRMKVALPPARQDPVEIIRQVLTSFSQTHRDLRRLLDEHVGPAVRAVWSGRGTTTCEPLVTQYGDLPRDPPVSIVVPLYGRFDFIEHQLAQFVDDPDVRRSDLIYVIDDPTIYDEVRLSCQELSRFYDVPFRLVYGRRNVGYAGACNLGANLARGRYVLLLNSDVLPKHQGWLAELVRAHQALPQAGAAAPKLLYEDGSIQHAGMTFTRLPIWGDMWVNDHPFKGQPNRAEREPVECPALTGACLLIERDLYRQVGGLSEDYVIGDFEDSDLCLRLLGLGRRNWLVPAVELYHLERQSQDRIGEAAWRINLSLYNCWLHTGRWDNEISRRMGVQ